MKMKKNFNDIMKQNLNEEDKWNRPMHGYVSEYNKFEREKLGIDKYGRYYSDQKDLGKESEDINKKCLEYIKEANSIKHLYENLVNSDYLKLKRLKAEFEPLDKRVQERENKHVLIKDGDEEIIRKELNRHKELKSEINSVESNITKTTNIFEERLSKLNNDLDEKVKDKLKEDNKYISTLKKNLEENIIYKNYENLSIYEENLIFGGSLSSFSDIIAMNETDVTAGNVNAYVNRTGKNKETPAQRHSNEMYEKYLKSEFKKSQRREEIKAQISGETIAVLEELGSVQDRPN